MAVRAGFHTTVFPITAGAEGRLPPILVKLKGVMAYTNPSRALYWDRFHIPGSERGCSP